MTIKELIEVAHCGMLENVRIHIYDYENKIEFKFSSKDELMNYSHYDKDLLNEKVVYFSFHMSDFIFTLSIRYTHNGWVEI